LKVRTSALDKMVREERSVSDDDAAALPHWNVEPLAAPVDGAALLNNLRQVFRRYIVLPKGADIALPLWVLHAWTFDAGEISPFMVLVSPVKRCGKTSVLILLYYLTSRSELASNISPSAIFRYIEEIRPTLLIDEADAFVKDNEELRGILNSGHTKAAANVIRNVEINGEHKPRRFSTWAPKAIATIRG
jgi:putative DNA primase/helicase